MDMSEYRSCSLCPRGCKTDRTSGSGYCGEDDRLSIDAYLLHKGEEPPISFKNGSGTVFFTGCSLRCPFCQNRQISQDASNKKYYTLDEFVNIMKGLTDRGAENINFVTPDHFLPHIIEGAVKLRSAGYDLPFVYNSSGYQSIRNLEAACDHMDIFLFDHKFADKEASAYCINNPDYPDVAAEALGFIIHKKGDLKTDSRGKALKGVIVRHLVMPGFVQNSIKVLNELYFEYGNKVFLSLMSQYSPHYLKEDKKIIARRLYKEEYAAVVEYADKLGFRNGFIQEFIEGEDGYLPDFDKKKIFGN